MKRKRGVIHLPKKVTVAAHKLGLLLLALDDYYGTDKHFTWTYCYPNTEEPMMSIGIQFYKKPKER